MSKYSETLDFLKKNNFDNTETALILGSGLGILADELEDRVSLAYSDIPGFPVSTVEGHKGALVKGNLNGKPVIAMQGRFHFYEGYDMKTLVYPVRIMHLLGVEKLVVTNAAGGVNTSYKPGNLMLISDHIKMVADSPLRGLNEAELGPRFNDMSEAYSKELRKTAKAAAEKIGISVQEGVYAYMTGPSYETPAEIRALRVMGADAVGMSTVPEVIAASHMGMKVLGISCITNMAAGILDQPLNHQEVVETANMVQNDFIKYIKEIISQIG